jgi:16S rRNA (guanine527-N7)-methyltransferase
MSEDSPDDTTDDSGSTAAGSATLSEALAAHRIELPAEQITQLEAYCRALWEMNTKLNLTRHTTWDKFVSRDLVDSQWLEKQLDPGERVLDLGTGGGVPGIVLAIIRPDLQVSLCDSVAKKARAVQEIVEQIGVPVTVHHAPVQAILPDFSFDTLVCRAVAPIPKLLFWLQPHWDGFNQLLLIKGPNWTAERDEAAQRKQMNYVTIKKIASYPLAGTESESVVLRVKRKV